MLRRFTPEALARSSSRHPWRTIGAWVLLVVLAGLATSQLLGDALTTDASFTNSPESLRAKHLIEERLQRPDRDTEFVIVSSDHRTVDDPAFRAAVEEVQHRLARLGPDVIAGTVSVYRSGDRTLVSKDRHATLVPVQMAGDLDQANDTIDRVHAVLDRGVPGFQVLVAGRATLSKDLNAIAEKDLQKGEGIGLLAALIVLVVVFGAIVAALLPIGIAILSIGVAVGLVALLGTMFEFSFFVTNMITMMGLAVAIDYCLFIVSRYREERGAGLAKDDAIAMAGATASRAVLFSGMTVVLALLGMLIIPTTIFRSLASGAILVVVVAVAAALTLLPAFLGLLGDRINKLRVIPQRRRAERDPSAGFWGGVARGVMRRPVVSLLLATAFLVLASLSYFRLETGFSGVSTLPDSVESKKAFGVLATEFAGGVTNPVLIAVDAPDVTAPAVQGGIEELRADLARDGEFGPSSVEVDAAKDLAVVSAPVLGDFSSEAAVASIDRIRDSYVPAAFPAGVAAQVLVGGDTALNHDFFRLTDQYQPIVLAFVLALSFVLLLMVFRSVVVPLKAILLNLLSVGAAYGLLSLVFQKSGPGIGKWLAGALGFQQVEAVEAWLPLFLFSVLFGLSMDYHVFLLSRIRERYVQTRDNAESVAYGLTRTGGIITGAALIMVAVFAGFAAGDMVMFQQMGFGLAVAVLIDATIIRSVLVPAAMKLLGERNWYFPKWLEWTPHLSVEGPPRPVVVDDARPDETERVPASV